MKLSRWMLPLAGLVSLCVGCTHESNPRGMLPVHQLDFGRTSPIRTGIATRPPTGNPPQLAGGIDPEWSSVPAIREWRYIVIHHSASDKGNAAIFNVEHHNRGWANGLGYDFVIDNGNGGPDGKVEVGDRWEKQIQGAHTGNTPGNEYNEHGIGICLVGNFNNGMPTQAQLASLHKLVGFLCSKYNIPAGRIVGHQDAPGTSTECPGKLLHSYVQNQLRRSVGS